MPVRLKLEGVPQLMKDLRKLPAELRDEARDIVTGHVDDAETEIRAGYAKFREPTGALEAGLQRRTLTAGGQSAGSQYGVKIELRNVAKHAHLVEIGTELPRQTRKGWNRGRMPAAKIMVPAIIRARRAMYDDLRRLLQRTGLVVSG